MGGTKCAASGCKNYMKKTTQIKYHRFPNDRYIDWLKLCGRHDLLNKDFYFINKNFRLCSLHFDSEMYANPDQTRLLCSAMPTIFNQNSELNTSENEGSDSVSCSKIQAEPSYFNVEDLLVEPLSNNLPTITENSR